jgi:hypothetical protein
MNGDELYRTVVGMLALGYRETRDGALLGADDGRELVRALFRDLGRGDVFIYASGSIEPTTEALSAMVKDAVIKAGRQVSGEFIGALSQVMVAFGAFCSILKEQNPSVDVEAALLQLAYRAAVPMDEE